MRRFDKKKNIEKVNLLAESRHLESKGLITEGVAEEAKFTIQKINKLIAKNPNAVLELHNEGKAYLYKFHNPVVFRENDNGDQWVEYTYDLSSDEGNTFRTEKKQRTLTNNRDAMYVSGRGKVTPLDTFRDDMNFIGVGLENEMDDVPKATDITDLDRLRAIPKTINYGGQESDDINEMGSMLESAGGDLDLTNPGSWHMLASSIFDTYIAPFNSNKTKDKAMTNDNKVLFLYRLLNDEQLGKSESYISFEYGGSGREIWTNDNNFMAKYLSRNGKDPEIYTFINSKGERSGGSEGRNEPSL